MSRPDNGVRLLGSYRVRQCTERDADAVFRFYLEHPSPFTPHRPIDRMLETIRRRRFFLIDNAESDVAYGIAAVFEHSQGRNRQLGGTRLAKEVGGFGLQPILLRLRALHERVVNAGYGELFSAIAADNEVSWKNATTAGLVPWPSPPADLGYEAAASEKPLQFLRLPPARYPEYARWLLETHGSVALTRTNRVDAVEERIELGFAVESLGYYRSELEALAVMPADAS